MTFGWFKEEHLNFIKDIGYSEADFLGDNHYIVAKDKIFRLEERLKLLSCGVDKMIEKDRESPYSKFCLLCRNEGYASKLIVGTDRFGAEFYGFPRSLYKLNANLKFNIKPGRRDEILTSYINGTLSDAFNELNYNPITHGFVYGEERKVTSVLHRVKDLVGMLKTINDLNNEKDKHEDFRLCSVHKDNDHIGAVKLNYVHDFIRETRNGLGLKEEDVEINLREEKIFSV